MKFRSAGAVVLAFALPLSADTTVTVKGSDTMVILNQRWAETYMSEHKGVIIQVTGGGSGTGIAALIGGSTDICASSRPMKDKEKGEIKKRTGAGESETPVALDGVAVYFHESNPLSELTLQQLKDIYIGKIINWKDVGGPDKRIIVYSRENNSGTYAFFKDHILNGRDFTAFAQTLPGTAAVANAVGKDKQGIGYGGAAYAKGIKYCAIKADAQTPAYTPTEENIRSGVYPASRPLLFYTVKNPKSETKHFIDWVLSPEGQGIAASVGYFPLR